MHRSVIFALAVAMVLSAAVGAQELQHSERSVQVSGLFAQNSNNTPTTHLANNSGGYWWATGYI
ncbi:MAG: hypothetical protein ACRD1C_13505 [Terriglobales bacterium]